MDTGERAQQLPRGIWPFSLRREQPYTCPQPHLSTLRKGPGDWGTGRWGLGGWWRRPEQVSQTAEGGSAGGAVQLQQHNFTSRGGWPAPRVDSSVVTGVRPCLHWFSGAWSPSTAGELPLGPVCNCPAGQVPLGCHLGPQPGLGGAWTGKAMGVCRGKGEQTEGASVGAPRTPPLPPPGLRVLGCPHAVLVPGGAFWAEAAWGKPLSCSDLATLSLRLQTQPLCLLAALGGAREQGTLEEAHCVLHL